ncbi:hypothetical protein NMY22_g6903 [Coprinellus aureogranulatus]|nr:hypothetical protein NMY22_g6903 [Coprinellus aureogranulatus]
MASQAVPKPHGCSHCPDRLPGIPRFVTASLLAITSPRSADPTGSHEYHLDSTLDILAIHILLLQMSPSALGNPSQGITHPERDTSDHDVGVPGSTTVVGPMTGNVPVSAASLNDGIADEAGGPGYEVTLQETDAKVNLSGEFLRVVSERACGDDSADDDKRARSPPREPSDNEGDGPTIIFKRGITPTEMDQHAKWQEYVHNRRTRPGRLIKQQLSVNPAPPASSTTDAGPSTADAGLSIESGSGTSQVNHDDSDPKKRAKRRSTLVASYYHGST